jgi:hypothetical protein
MLCHEVVSGLNEMIFIKTFEKLMQNKHFVVISCFMVHCFIVFIYFVFSINGVCGNLGLNKYISSILSTAQNSIIALRILINILIHQTINVPLKHNDFSHLIDTV